MLNKIIANSIPYLPKRFIWLFSKRYVAGESLEENLQISKELNTHGMLVTVDILGEFINSIKEAEQNKNAYLSVVRKYHQEKILGSFSIKPSSFGLLIDQDKCYELIREVVREAAMYDRFVRIDMEDSSCTDMEIELFLRLRAEFPNHVGLVLQAYLRRTPQDLNYLIKVAHSTQSPLNIRLCKGIYIESEKIAYTDFHEIRSQFLGLLNTMLKRGVYVGIATHDQFIVNEAFSLIDQYQVSSNKYEFQMLYGVAPALRDKIVGMGHKMRIYVPFGKQWFAYCSRRIKENPRMVSDIVKAVFVRG